jgi:hypothetical protein
MAELSRRSVTQFGARADGQTDDSAAFNAATQAASDWDEALGGAIYIPAGRYRIDRPIRVRKGQHLFGDGEATLIDASRASGPTLTLGLDEKGRIDPGGAPVGATGLRFLGGSGSAPVIKVHAAGFALSHLFLSAAGTAIEVSGSDGVISDVVVDQALRGLVFRSAQNIVVQGLVTYLANFAITLEEASNDIVLAQAVLAYSRYASVLFAEGAAGIGSVRFTACDFLSNEAFSTFLGHVHVRSQPCDAQFSACTFRNHPGFAVRQQAGTGAELSFDGCVFDGSPSSIRYSASASSAGLLTGAGARLSLSGCRFRALAGPAVAIGPDLANLVWQGGSLSAGGADPLRFEGKPSGRFSVSGVNGFGRTNGDGSLVLPWRGATTAWRIAARATRSPGGFAAADCVIVGQANGHSVTLLEAAGPSLDLSACFGERPGGQTRTHDDQGVVCLSAAGRSDLEWSAETIG